LAIHPGRATIATRNVRPPPEPAMPVVSRLAFVASLFVAPGVIAQVQIDDRPKLLKEGPLTREELNRKKVDQLLREARTLYGLGVMQRRGEKLLEAITAMEKAAKLDPESNEVCRELVPLYAAVGREDEAMTLCRRVLDRDPHDTETAYQFARLLRADGRPAEAIQVLEKAVSAKEARDKPDRLLVMLADLSDLLEKKGDHAGVARAQDAIIQTINEKRDQLLYGTGLSRDELQGVLARAHERLGEASVRLKEYDRAAAAFRGARDTLLKSDDPQLRREAVRINWNVCEMAAAQGRWPEAMAALDSYLEHGPAEVEPYEKKVELLRKLDRAREVVPALRKLALQQEHHLGLQLLLARELTKDSRTRHEAEALYLGLLKKHIKPEIYRGLFRLYQADGRMGDVLDLFDDAAKVAAAKDEDATATEREAAQERARSMVQALRTEPPLVAALLERAVPESSRERRREFNTWALLAALAARAHKLDDAERLFRNCLVNLPPEFEYQVYAGLIEVLRLQKKHADIVTLCRAALAGPRRARNTNAAMFESNLAIALAEQGKYDEALTHAEAAIKLMSEEDKVRARCMKANILARAERYAEAVRECEETIREFPRPALVREVRYALSNVYSLKGDHAKSEAQLRLILDADPDAHLANNNLGYQMADRNTNLDEAERLIRRAIDGERGLRKAADEDGDNAAYLDSLGWVLFRKGQLAEAREWIEKAAALPDGADDPTVWDHLGDIYAKMDLRAKAKEAWQTSLKLYESSYRKKRDTRPAEVERKLKALR
jgi:tetratricopeptide (TPR) repeat protein